MKARPQPECLIEMLLDRICEKAALGVGIDVEFSDGDSIALGDLRDLEDDGWEACEPPKVWRPH